MRRKYWHVSWKPGMIPADLIRAIDVLLTLPKRMPQPTLAAPDFEVATYPTWLPFPMQNSLAPKMTGWPKKML